MIVYQNIVHTVRKIWMYDFGVVLKSACVLILFIVVSSINAHAKDYVIGGGDTLQISVWGSPQLSIEVMVRPDGKISVPAVGEIKASGLTPLELTDVLKREIKKLVKTPVVTVIVTGMTNYRIFVFGRGATSGMNILTRKTTLLELLSQFQSLDNADLENSYLVRDKKRIKTNLFDLFEKGDFSQDIILEPNDMLYIPDIYEKRISVVGAVMSPTIIPYREGITVLDVILTAGGFTEFANKNNVKIYRMDENGEKKKISAKVKDLMKGDLSKNMKVEPGDIVVVKERLF